MVLDVEKQAKIEEFIETNEQTQWLWGFAETVAELAWVEKETKEWFLSKWLKNDENLLAYAELAMKTEKLSIWESITRLKLEVILNFTCRYFAEFKNFLQELKRWHDTSTTDESTNASSTETWNMGTSSTWTATSETSSEASETLTHTFCWTTVNSIKSEPFEKNSSTWVTWCSKTARFNWKNFWIMLPSWNAYDAWQLPWKSCLTTIPIDKQNEKPTNKRKWIDLEKFNSVWEWNYADIYTDTKSPKYGHRAAAFKDDSWQWYVLDPYTRVNWKLDDSPKKLEDYLKFRKIVKAHIYESKWYKKSNSDVYDDEWEGYEWWTK